MPAERVPRRARANGELVGQDRRVYDCVLAAVMAHRLLPGTKLVEASLREPLSRTRCARRERLHLRP